MQIILHPEGHTSCLQKDLLIPVPPLLSYPFDPSQPLWSLPSRSADHNTSAGLQ